MDRKTSTELINIGRIFNMDIYGYMPKEVSPTKVKAAYAAAGYDVVVRSTEYSNNRFCVFYENKRIVPVKLDKNI